MGQGLLTMNLSHNGNMSTTNVVWKNLENSIKLSVVTVAATEAQLTEYYNTEYKILQELSAKTAKIIGGLNDIINKSSS